MCRLLCSAAALNCQTIGKAMDMNEGLFKANGYSGYYLKPAAMRDGKVLFRTSLLFFCGSGPCVYLAVGLIVTRWDS